MGGWGFCNCFACFALLLFSSTASLYFRLRLRTRYMYKSGMFIWLTYVSVALLSVSNYTFKNMTTFKHMALRSRSRNVIIHSIGSCELSYSPDTSDAAI